MRPLRHGPMIEGAIGTNARAAGISRVVTCRRTDADYCACFDIESCLDMESCFDIVSCFDMESCFIAPCFDMVSCLAIASSLRYTSQ